MQAKRARPKKSKYAEDAEIFNRAILASRLSPREIAYRFGIPEEKIRAMMAGDIKPSGIILHQLRG
jgi:hypothetical protein